MAIDAIWRTELRDESNGDCQRSKTKILSALQKPLTIHMLCKIRANGTKIIAITEPVYS